MSGDENADAASAALALLIARAQVQHSTNDGLDTKILGAFSLDVAVLAIFLSSLSADRVATWQWAGVLCSLAVLCANAVVSARGYFPAPFASLADPTSVVEWIKKPNAIVAYCETVRESIEGNRTRLEAKATLVHKAILLTALQAALAIGCVMAGLIV